MAEFIQRDELTVDEMRAALLRAAQRQGYAVIAQATGYEEWDVKRMTRAPNCVAPAVARHLGYERVVLYRKSDAEAQDHAET